MDPGFSKAKLYPFNFYVIPYFEDFLGTNFACSSSAIEFLCRSGTDFNKWFYEGVNYISLEREKKLSELHLQKKLRKEISTKEKEALTDFKKLLHTNSAEINQLVLNAQTDRSKTWAATIGIEYVRLVVYKTLEEHLTNTYPDLFLRFSYDSEHVPKRKLLIVTAHSKEESELIKAEEAKKILNEPSSIELGGFRGVIETISNSEKPILVHNGFLDCMYIYKAFVGELPLRQEEFKEKFSYYFPYIYDSKYLSKSGALKKVNFASRTDLSTCYNAALMFKDEYPLAELDSEMFEYRMSDLKQDLAHHEAAFDAMATGYTFLKLADCKLLIEDKSNSLINKLHLNSMDDIFDLKEPQSKSKRRQVYRCTVYSQTEKVNFRYQDQQLA